MELHKTSASAGWMEGDAKFARVWFANVTYRRSPELCFEDPEPRRMSFLPHGWTQKRLVIAAAVVVMACSSQGISPLPQDGKLPLGTWGGDNAGMIVSDTAMHLHIGCTFGDVSGRIMLDTHGGFDVAGSYMLRAYPVAVGPSVPARFVGRVDGTSTKVTVTVNDTIGHATVVKGPVVVQYGDEPRMGTCPICRRPVFTRHRN